MGVHNLHGVAGWIGAIAAVLILAVNATMDEALTNLVAAVGVFGITLLLGIVVGFVLKLTRGPYPDENMFSDDIDFIRSEEP
jgi:ammonium transporter Rh